LHNVLQNKMVPLPYPGQTPPEGNQVQSGYATWRRITIFLLFKGAHTTMMLPVSSETKKQTKKNNLKA